MRYILKGIFLPIFCVVFSAISSAAFAQTIDDLCTAVTDNDLAEVNRLAAVSSIDVDAACPDDTEFGGSPLHQAANYNFVAVASALIDAGADVNVTTSVNGSTPLHWAAFYGDRHIEMVEFLSTVSAVDVDAQDSNGDTPLHRSARYNGPQAAQALIDAGAGVNITNSISNYDTSEWAPLYTAARFGNADVVRVLLGATGVDIQLADDAGFSPLHTAALNGYADIIKMLIAADAAVDDPSNDDMYTPLHSAVFGAHSEVVQALIDAGANVNAGDMDYNAIPLHWAAHRGNAQIAQILLDAGASADVRDNNNDTPLHWAAFGCNGSDDGFYPPTAVADAAQVLINAGADMTLTNDSNQTPLQTATSEAATLASSHCDELIALLQGMAFTPEPVTYSDDIDGLCSAVADDNLAEVQRIAALTSVNPDDACPASQSEARPLHWSAEFDYADIAQALIDANANVNITNTSGTTPLYWAASYNHTEVAEALIAASADVNIGRTSDGLSPVTNAGWWGNADLVQALVDAGADTTGKTGGPRTSSLSEVIFGRRVYALDADIRADSQGEHLQAMKILITTSQANVNSVSGPYSGSNNPLRPIPTGNLFTALHLAAYYCDVAQVNDLAQLLVDNGADLTAEANVGTGAEMQTALQIAQSRPTSSQCTQLVALLDSDCPKTGERGYAVEGQTEPVCATALPAAEYNTSDCEARGWDASYVADANNNILARCEIPVTLQATDPTGSASAFRSGEVAPLQVAAGESYDSCVLAAHSGYSLTGLAECDDENLFAGNGLPQKPAGFDDAPAAQQTLVVVPPPAVAQGETRQASRVYFQPETNGAFVEIMLIRTAVSSGGGGNSKSKDAAYIGAGVFVVGAMAVFLSGGDWNLFSFSPDYGYSFTESGYFANAGARMDFRKDEWHLYANATQTNRNGEFGDFRYVSGGEYRAEIWRATFSESVQGKTADYDFSLSADFSEGIWKLSPTYRLRSRFEESDAGVESETRNSLNLESVLTLNRWTIRPTVGFSWQNENDFGDGAKFRINAVHRF